MKEANKYDYLLMTVYYLLLSAITDLAISGISLATFGYLKALSVAYNLFINRWFVKNVQSDNKEKRVRQQFIYTLIAHGPIIPTILVFLSGEEDMKIVLFFFTNLATSVFGGLFLDYALTTVKQSWGIVKKLPSRRRKKKHENENDLPPAAPS